MTEPKQPWPKPEPFAMTTNEKKTMELYVNAESAGMIWREKLRRAYKAGFLAAKPKEEFKIHDGELPE